MSRINLLHTEREKIREQWGKSETEVHEYITLLREWIKTQKHLPEIPDDNTIECFLTNCKYSIEKTKTNLDMYYSARDIVPEFYHHQHPLKYPEQTVMFPKMGELVSLPKQTKNLYRITIFRLSEEPAENFYPNILMAGILNLFEVRLHEDLIMGEIVILDFANATFGHAVKLTPTLFKNSSFILEKVWSNRLKEVHIINVPPFADFVLNIAKQFLKKKLFDRIFLHLDLESLYKHVSRELLPVDYGGDQKSLAVLVELWRAKFKEYSARFDKLEELKVNESLRPEPLINSEFLGYYGNIKKLEVD